MDEIGYCWARPGLDALGSESAALVELRREYTDNDFNSSFSLRDYIKKEKKDRLFDDTIYLPVKLNFRFFLSRHQK